MLLKREGLAVSLAACALLFGACAVGQSAPPPPRPFGEVESEEAGAVLSVHDTMIDLRTGQSRSFQAHAPPIALGPIAVAVPVSIGGESRRDVPGEEITVQLASGKLILVVQELSHPAFARGERVRVLHERPNLVTGESRTRVVREE
jgi:hypothetical protein